MKEIIVLLCVIGWSAVGSFAFGGGRIAELDGQDRFFDALRTGDDAVLASIVQIIPSAVPEKVYHTGVVVIDVQDWWKGSGKSRLRLPYRYQRTGIPVHVTLLYVWPPIEKLKKGDLLICVFKPGVAAAGPDGTAALVWSVSGKDDPIVAAVKKVISLDSDKTAADWGQKLAAGLNDPEPLVRQYCIDAVVHDIGEKKPADAMSLLADHLGRFAEINPGPIEISSTMSEIERLVAEKDSKLAETAIRALAMAIDSDKNNDRVRACALQWLAHIVELADAPRAAQILTDQQVADLKNGLDHVGAPKSGLEKQKASVLKWLSKGA